MFKSLRIRLAVTYSLIIILTILAVDFLILNNYYLSLLDERKITFFTYGSMVSDAASDNYHDPLSINNILEDFTNTTGARYLLINTESQVLADSMSRLQGEYITNPQIRNGLKGNEACGIYDDGRRVMQIAVPVKTGTRGNLEVIGIILLSTGIDDLYANYTDVRWQVAIISILAGVSGVMVSFIASYSLSNPIKKLIGFSRRLSGGHLGETVTLPRKDEIGRLADTINFMSLELHKIETNRRKFIGNVSHELKTPLASIKALVESLLIGENLSGKAREFLRDVVNEVDRLSSLIKGLLTYTRLEEERLHRETLMVSEIVRNTVKIMAPLAQSHNVTIENIVKEKIRVPCDKNLFKEMLVNLLDNSIKYRDMQKAENRIVLSDHADKNLYRINISDNGIGISEENLPLIFEGFFRGELSRSKDIEGYGMGLTIVKKIADLHKWNIRVDSKLGIGTTFTIDIPLNS